jgi:hypothetical protein
VAPSAAGRPPVAAVNWRPVRPAAVRVAGRDGPRMITQGCGRWDHHNPARSWIWPRRDRPGLAPAAEGWPRWGLVRLPRRTRLRVPGARPAPMAAGRRRVLKVEHHHDHRRVWPPRAWQTRRDHDERPDRRQSASLVLRAPVTSAPPAAWASHARPSRAGRAGPGRARCVGERAPGCGALGRAWRGLGGLGRGLAVLGGAWAGVGGRGRAWTQARPPAGPGWGYAVALPSAGAARGAVPVGAGTADGLTNWLPAGPAMTAWCRALPAR